MRDKTLILLLKLVGEGGVKDKYWSNTKTKRIKVWESNKIWEFDLSNSSIENILESMNF